jgi:hypothetical protein
MSADRPTPSPRRRSRVLRRALVVAGLIGGSLVSVVGLGAGPAVADGPYGVPASGAWTVNGAGWGHGIGMSQWGAQGAALQGVPFDQILAFYYPGTTLGWVGNPNIRVQLTRHAGDANVFGGIGGETPSVYDQHSGHTEALPAASRYLVTADGAGMHLAYMTPGGWAPLSFNGSGNIVGPIEVVAPSGVSMYDLNLATGRQYRGMMRIIRSGTTGVQAVNVLPMDDYLRGVVPRESPSSWHAEALRSQAVAARSYALSVSRSGGGWDLCDTDLCQVYGAAPRSQPTGR